MSSDEQEDERKERKRNRHLLWATSPNDASSEGEQSTANPMTRRRPSKRQYIDATSEYAGEEGKQEEDEPPAWANTDARSRRQVGDERDPHVGPDAEEEEWIGVAQTLMAEGEESSSAAEVLQRQRAAEITHLLRLQDAGKRESDTRAVLDNEEWISIAQALTTESDDGVSFADVLQHQFAAETIHRQRSQHANEQNPQSRPVLDDEEWVSVVQALTRENDEGGSLAEMLQHEFTAEAIDRQSHQLPDQPARQDAQEHDSQQLDNSASDDLVGSRPPRILDAAYYSTDDSDDKEKTRIMESDIASAPRPEPRAEAASPSSDEQSRLESASFVHDQQPDDRESINFFLFMAYMTEEEAANVSTRYASFLALYRRRQRKNTGKAKENNDSAFFEHTGCPDDAGIPVKDVRFLFTLWFLFKTPRQVRKLPSRSSLQTMWNYFYERMDAVQGLVDSVLESTNPTPFFREAFRAREAFSGDDDNDNQETTIGEAHSNVDGEEDQYQDGGKKDN